MRRIGVLLYLNEQDVEAKTCLATFAKQLSELGWKVGGNLQIDYRWPAATPRACGNTRRNWLRSRRKSFWSRAAPMSDRCSSSPARSRSCSCRSPTRSEAGSSKAWRAPAATPPDSPISNSTSAANGWSCSGRSHRTRCARRCCAIPPSPWHRTIRRHPGGGTRARDRGHADQPARRRRDRAGRQRVRRAPNGGLIVTAAALAFFHRNAIAHVCRPAQTARGLFRTLFRYCRRSALLWTDRDVDQFRRSAGYVDRILKGESGSTCRCRRRPNTSLSINLKTAKALDLENPTGAARPRRRGDRVSGKLYIGPPSAPRDRSRECDIMGWPSHP